MENLEDFLNVTEVTDFPNTTSTIPTRVGLNLVDMLNPRILAAYKIHTRYFPVVITVLSVLGNGLLLIVLGQPKNRHLTTSMYLMALAVADLLATARNFAFWLDILYGVSMDCGFMNFLEQFSMTSSSWILAIISFERVISVGLPLKVKQICTPLHVKIILAATTVLFCAYGVMYGILFTRKVILEGDRYKCVVPEQYAVFYTYYMRWISQCLHSTIPLVVIFVNSVIIVTLLFRRMASKTASRAGRSIAVNIVLINLAFLVTRFPTNFLYLYQVINQASKSYLEQIEYMLVLECSYQWRDLNSVLNFYIYFLAGTKFRQDTKELLCRICPRRQKDHITGRIADVT